MSTYIVEKIPLVANTTCKLNILIKQVTCAFIAQTLQKYRQVCVVHSKSSAFGGIQHGYDNTFGESKCQRDHIRPPFSRYNPNFGRNFLFCEVVETEILFAGRYSHQSLEY